MNHAKRWVLPAAPHAVEVADLLAGLESSPRGLTPEEAERRRHHFGPNRPPRKPPPGAAILFLRQFASPLIYVLLLAPSCPWSSGRPPMPVSFSPFC